MPSAYDAKNEIEALKAAMAELKTEIEDVQKKALAHYKKSVWMQARLLPDTMPKRRNGKKTDEAEEETP
jgi:hypothetical protein